MDLLPIRPLEVTLAWRTKGQDNQARRRTFWACAASRMCSVIEPPRLESECNRTKVEGKSIWMRLAPPSIWTISSGWGRRMAARKRRTEQARIVDVFAERLKALRIARGKTQRQLAHDANVTLTYISRLEAGGAAPGIDLLERLAVALDAHVTDLLPTPSHPSTAAETRDGVKALVLQTIEQAGPETLSMLQSLMAHLSGSPLLRK
jgi:transcriptional regulator with XRE-family HTH domain